MHHPAVETRLLNDGKKLVPLDDAAPQWLTDLRLRRLLFGFLLLGLLVRAVRYFLCFPLWQDECYLGYNLIDRGYLDLMEPLSYHQVAPLFFLWTQLTVVKLLGFSEYTLRLVPFICSLGSLILFRYVAGMVWRGVPLLASVAVFSVAYPNIRYAGEAKPYGVDVLVTLVLLALVLNFCKKPTNFRWLWTLTAFVPIALGMSYPSVFVAGGVSLAVAYTLWRSRAWRGVLPWIAYNTSLVAGFFGFFLLTIRSQNSNESDFMGEFWNFAFPPLHSLLEFLSWIFSIHAGEMLAYPVGDSRGGSTAALLLLVLGAVGLIRSRRYELGLLFLIPLGLNFVAAVMHRYPYGGHARIMVYLSAVFCLLIGGGTAVVVGWLRRRKPAVAGTFFVLVLSVDLAIGAGSIVRDVAQPYKTIADENRRNFARWFWSDLSYSGEVVCLHRDLKFEDNPDGHLSFKVQYLCNQQIYSPRHARRESPQWDRISKQWPLRCVHFYDPQLKHAYDREALQNCLAEIQEEFVLVSEDEFPFVQKSKSGKRFGAMDYIYVMKFVPKTERQIEVAEHLKRFPPLR